MYQNESIFRKCFEAKTVVIRTEWPLCRKVNFIPASERKA